MLHSAWQHCPAREPTDDARGPSERPRRPRPGPDQPLCGRGSPLPLRGWGHPKEGLLWHFPRVPLATRSLAFAFECAASLQPLFGGTAEMGFGSARPPPFPNLKEIVSIKLDKFIKSNFPCSYWEYARTYEESTAGVFVPVDIYVKHCQK